MRRSMGMCALVGLGSWGCSHGAPELVPCGEQLNEVCVGVENEVGDRLGPCPCSGPAIEVSNHDELAAALAGNPACITLADGAYGVAELRNGFSIVGASAEGVVLQWLSFIDGAASACRMTTTGAYVAKGASGTMQYLSVEGSPEDGVRVDEGADARIVGTTIHGSERYGVSAFGIRSLAVERSLIAGTYEYGRPGWPTGPGIWASCPDGCACAVPPEVTVHDSVVRHSALIGISIVGAHTDFRNVRIAQTVVSSNFAAGLGLGISQCSTVTATHLEVVDSADAGICVDGSKVEFDDVQVSGNLRGLFVHSASAPAEVHIAGAAIRDNLGIGLAITSATFAVVDDSIVEDTKNIALPLPVSGVSASAALVGDGICWNGTAVAHMHRVTVSGSERNGILIHGPASGILEDVVVPGGRIFQVNYESGSQPLSSGTTPSIQTSAGDEQCAEDVYPMPPPP